jgi:ATP-binding cassette subfamily B protein RaxB
MNPLLNRVEPNRSGLACLVSAAWLLGDKDAQAASSQSTAFLKCATPNDLADLGGSLKLMVRPLRCAPEDFSRLGRFSILQWGEHRYVLFDRIVRGGVRIFDPVLGWRVTAWSALREHYTGVAIEVGPAPDFQRRREQARLSTLGLFRWSPDLAEGLGQVLLLSFFLQAYVMVSPFYMRVVIDQAVMKADSNLLVALALGFGIFGVFNVGATLLRGIAVQKITALLNWDLTRRVYGKLIRLPLAWFQSQRVADILMRLQGLEPIRSLVAGGLVSVLIDGLLSVLTFGIMMFASVKLALIALATLAIYVTVRLVAIPTSLHLLIGTLRTSTAEQSKRMEIIRTIQTIKALAAEPERENDWAETFGDTIREGQANSLANLGFGAVNQLATSMATVIVVYFGAQAIIDNQMTIGMLFAFTAYQSQFMARGAGLFEQVVAWRMLSLHTSRLGDIVLTPAEKNIHKPILDHPPFEGRVQLSDVSFQYAPHSPPILLSANLLIEPGEFVAIVGASGSGKSTLLQILCGLLPPVRGDVLMDGVSLNHWGPRTVRKNMGIVMQEDALLIGSIAENVAFFAENPDAARIRECLTLAGIEKDVSRLPMQEETQIGDIGQALSGGQRQRILIARALYRRPSILLLDEATAHLDTPLEKFIAEMLTRQKMTRIVIAHSQTLIEAADRVILVEKGSLRDITRKRVMEDGVI